MGKSGLHLPEFMMMKRISVLVVALTLTMNATSYGQNLLENVTSNINIEGLETSFDPETGIATATGDVHIKYGDTEITAGKADYNASSGDVMARENVTVWKAGVTYKGQNLMYNIKTNEITGNAVRSGMGSNGGNVLFDTQKFETETKFIDRIDGQDTILTTHDNENPNYRIKARELIIYPDNRIVMKRVTVYAGKTPVFWLPYLAQPLDDDVGYKFVPGYSQLWGAFLLNQYGVIHGDHTLAKYHFDLMSERGIAGGVDLISMRHRANQQNFGTLKIYVASDSNGQATISGTPRLDEVDTVRYRVNFQHRIYLPGPDVSTWYLDFDVNKLSDIHFYEDYFFEDFRTNREPDNQVSLIHSDPRYQATLMGKFQLNDFYRTTTRLPELSIDVTRQPLGDFGVFYQGSSSLGILQEKFSEAEKLGFQDQIRALNAPLVGEDGTLQPSAASTDRAIRDQINNLRALADGTGFARFHTYNEFLFPKTFGGWLNVVPRIGGGMTYYGDIQGGAEDVGDEIQPIFHAGVDISFKATKNWDNVQSDVFGLDGVRHVVRPYLNYSYLNTDDPEGVPNIDRLAPTTRARNIDIPLFTAIDDLRSWNVARVGIQNIFQTRRDYQSFDRSQGQFRVAGDATTQSYNWAGMNTFVDIFVEDPEYDRTISNLYNELFWRPVPWLNFFSDTQIPIGDSDYNFTELNHGITWLPSDKISLTLSHQYVSDHPFLQDSSLISSVIYARLSENWGVSMNHQYEMDSGTMQYQSYSVHRDLNSWVMSLGARMLDSTGGGDGDLGVVFSLTLKDFPQVSVPFDAIQNPMRGTGGF